MTYWMRNITEEWLDLLEDIEDGKIIQIKEKASATDAQSEKIQELYPYVEPSVA